MTGGKTQQTINDLRASMLAVCAVQRRVDAMGMEATRKWLECLGVANLFAEWEAATLTIGPKQD